MMLGLAGAMGVSVDEVDFVFGPIGRQSHQPWPVWIFWPGLGVVCPGSVSWKYRLLGVSVVLL